ncbi:MAG TPA: phosphoglucosamine mutase [Chthonomonadales bacterium]|nr:phosphoglucosamine mutase [Chthonomonadales bacterium]
MPRTLSLKIGISGVRGIVGESLTPQLVTSFGAAFGTHCGMGPVLVGTDSRPSYEMVKHAVIAGLLSVGCTPVDVGILPVPSLQMHVRATGANGAVCISASHNPIEWNAVKFIGPDGIILRPDRADEVTDLYHQGVFPRVTSHEIAEEREDHTAIERHRETVLAAVDADVIRARGFRVAVDCCNGGASVATPAFLRALGCDVVELYTDPTLPFPHHPEPLPGNIGDLCRTVRESGADLGFAQDADADRLAIVNERGEALGEDCTVTLAIHDALQRQPGPVVVNISTSRMVDDVAAAHGVTVHRTRVGEINVVERLLQTGAAIGGEGNGGVIVPAINPCRDSFVAMALVLEALARDGGTMSELRARVPTYAIVREHVGCAARYVATSLRKIARLFDDRRIDRTDGIKVLWEDRWLLVRPSNTEPVLRVEAEAPTEDEAHALVLEALETLCPTR